MQRKPISVLTQFRHPQADQKAIIVNNEIRYETRNVKFGFKDIFFRYSSTSSQLDLELHIRGWDQKGEGSIEMISKRLLIDLLGEYDLENEIDWIRYVTLNENKMEGLYPIIRLRELVDKRKSSRKIPLNTFQNWSKKFYLQTSLSRNNHVKLYSGT